MKITTTRNQFLLLLDIFWRSSFSRSFTFNFSVFLAAFLLFLQSQKSIPLESFFSLSSTEHGKSEIKKLKVLFFRSKLFVRCKSNAASTRKGFDVGFKALLMIRFSFLFVPVNHLLRLYRKLHAIFSSTFFPNRFIYFSKLQTLLTTTVHRPACRNDDVRLNVITL